MHTEVNVNNGRTKNIAQLSERRRRWTCREQVPHDEWSEERDLTFAYSCMFRVWNTPCCWFPSGWYRGCVRRHTSILTGLPNSVFHMQRVASLEPAEFAPQGDPNQHSLMIGTHSAPCRLSNTRTSGHTSQTQLPCHPRHLSV